MEPKKLQIQRDRVTLVFSNKCYMSLVTNMGRYYTEENVEMVRKNILKASEVFPNGFHDRVAFQALCTSPEGLVVRPQYAIMRVERYDRGDIVTLYSEDENT